MFIRRIPLPLPGFVVCQTRSLGGGGGGGGGINKMKVDVVVAGGGMVGSAAAGALAQLGKDDREEDMECGLTDCSVQGV